jgi:hypothetical protein
MFLKGSENKDFRLYEPYDLCDNHCHKPWYSTKAATDNTQMSDPAHIR